MNIAVTRWCLTIAAMLVAGCVPMINKPSYPAEWPPAISDRVGACPAIAGKYVNRGQLYIEAGIKCPQSPMRKGSAFWSCDLELGPNLGVALPATTVEITQPDAETTSVTMLDGSGVALETRTLHFNKEYQCDTEALYFSASDTHVDPLIPSALQHRRAFVRDTKGELVMTVRDELQALAVFIGILKSETSYVRWAPAGVPAIPASPKQP